MELEIWGTRSWIFLHCVTFGYPTNPTNKDKNDYNIFFNTLQYVLPSKESKENYTILLKKMPLTDDVLSSREKLTNWMNNMHNYVNKSNNKSVMSHNDTTNKYRTAGPKIWGPSGWYLLHSISLGYPEIPSRGEQNDYKIFFTNLQNVLPCKSCREHYKKNLATYVLTDDTLSKRTKLINWLISVHNSVNRSNKKVEMSISDAIRINTYIFNNDKLKKK
jgi:hypothetical protein